MSPARVRAFLLPPGRALRNIVVRNKELTEAILGESAEHYINLASECIAVERAVAAAALAHHKNRLAAHSDHAPRGA